MSLVSIKEVTELISEDIPAVAEMGIIFEIISDSLVRARLPFDASSLRSGGTISGPTMMGLGDIVVFVSILSRIGIVKDTVTTNLNANFLRKPGPSDLIAEGNLIKLGQRLAYGQVNMFSEKDPDNIVCHVTSTYSIPPKN